MKTIEKPWGKEEILETNELYTVKRLTMLKGHKCSTQYHEYKKETIYVLEGILKIYVGYDLDSLDIIYLNVGESITIDPFIVHRMEAENIDSIYLESSTSELNDVVRLQDDYSRISEKIDMSEIRKKDGYRGRYYIINRNEQNELIGGKKE
jgi:mannose-6-phosphate isomerase-like protein (cupin superfamily)